MVVTGYLRRIEKTDAFIFGTIVILSLYFSTTMFPIDIRHIAGILIGVIVVFLLNDYKRSDITSFNHEFEIKLSKIIPRPEYFHTDVNIIDLFDNISDFKNYNKEAWVDLIGATDSVLRLHSDMKKGVLHCSENIDVAKMFKNNAVNHFHTFIMSLPSNQVLNNKFKNNIARLELLLRRHIDDMYGICKNQYKNQGWSIQRRPLTNVGPRPNDQSTPSVSAFDYYY